MIKRRFFAATLIAAAVSSAFAQAVPADATASSASVAGQSLTPLVDYLKPPQYAAVRLSPDGRHLAVSTPVNGRLNLAVVDLQTRKGTALTNFGDFDVLGTTWVGNDRLVFTLGQFNSPTGPGQYEGGGLFVVSREGGDLKQLSQTVREFRQRGDNVYRGYDFGRRIPGNSNEIIVTGNLRSADAEDVYRMDLRTGRTTVVSEDRPPRTSGWILDANLVPRVVRSWVKDTSTYLIFYRAAAGGPWKEIGKIDETGKSSFIPLGILTDNKTLLVAANPGRDTMAVYKYDPEAGKLGDVVAQHPRFDMGADAEGERVPGVVLEPDTDRLIGYRVAADRPQTVWIDEKAARTQALVDRALPAHVNSFTRFPNSTRLLVSSFSDVSPARYYLLDEEKKTLEELFASNPSLDSSKLVEMRPFVLKTRDGLEIPSYYFLPKSYQPGQKLPTVVHIHGGPHARADGWGTGFGYREAEVLASRGYAVVLPNFRITPGFGAKIYTQGFGTIGRQMSEDHEDAARWAVTQGFADPQRMCISGASYGSYAALRALAKTPDLFKCGVAGLIVADLEMQLTSTFGDTAYNPAGVEFWKQIIGKDAKGDIAYRETSPVYMADRIKAPVFLYAGADDVRTPIEQANAMARALSRAGNPPKEFLVKKEEGHGYGRLENNLDLYTKMLKFLGDSIGPGVPSGQVAQK